MKFNLEEIIRKNSEHIDNSLYDYEKPFSPMLFGEDLIKWILMNDLPSSLKHWGIILHSFDYNINKIRKHTNISRTTISKYFEILKETLKTKYNNYDLP